MRRYGLKLDDPDDRDHKFKLSWFSPKKYFPLPDSVDLRPWMPPVMDQGSLGSCTAHGVTAALRYNLINNGRTDYPLSRLQLYYDTRALEGDIPEDNGAQIRNVIKCAAKNGVGRESLWPYDQTKWTQEPPQAVYDDAKHFEALDYRRVDIDSRAIKTALYVGRPVVIGIAIFPSFESNSVAATGVVPLPGWNEKSIGGHCMTIHGYQDDVFTVRNSWGTGWGALGDCFIPAAYIEKYGSDFWTIATNNE